MMYDDVRGSKEVPYCHTDVAHKKLGVMLKPDDNNKSQIIIMRQISSKFGERVRICFIKGEDVLLAMSNILSVSTRTTRI